MTVRNCSADGSCLTSIASATFALLMLFGLGLSGNLATYGEEPAPPAADAQSGQSAAADAPVAEDSPAPETPADTEPAAESKADAPAAPAPPADATPEETKTPEAPDPAADGQTGGTPKEDPPATGANDPPSDAPADGASNAESPAPAPPEPETADAAPAALPKPEAGEAAPGASEPSTVETPPAPAAEAMAGEEPGKVDATPLPPKPAEADVLESVLPSEAAPETANQAPAQPPTDATNSMPRAVAQDVTAGENRPSDPDIDLPPDVAAAMDDFMADDDQKTLRFTFRYQPWEKVLQWFADQSDLSLIMDAPPPGTFNYTDNRNYTPAEAIDLLNSVLLTKGYTLVRRDRMLMVINLEDGIPPNLVTTIPVEDLDKRGEFELVGVVFQLQKFDPEEAAEEVKKLIGPQGSVVALPRTRQLYVTETAGRLRTIRDVIQRVEDPQGIASGRLESYEFKNILPDEGLMVLRQLMDIPLDANATEDDTFRFAMDPVGMRLLFSGVSDKIAKAKEILEAIDQSSGDGTTTTAMESLQLEVYPIAVADPDSVLKVMQTLLEGLPGVRLSIDPKTGSLVALARPKDHDTIRATIQQMEADVPRIEVIYLQRVDPQLAAVSIKKMFGDASSDDEKKKSTAPTVEPDPAGHQLIVHGTENQIAQIRVLLGKMGETEFADGPAPSGSRIRVLPITGRSAEATLENLRMVWPTISDNPIKVVNPSAMMPALKPRETIPSRVPAKDYEAVPERRDERRRRPPMGGLPNLNRLPQPESVEPPATDPAKDRQTSYSGNARFYLVSQTSESAVPEAAEDSPSDQPAPASEQPKGDAADNASPPTPEPEQQPAPSKQKSPIIISVGPNGLMIASDDVEALDEFERLFNSMTGGADSDRTELNIFYLKYAKATVVADTLTKIIGSGTTGSATASEDSILGQLVGSAVGGTMGSLLNMGAATLSPTGMLRITPEPRLNALIVEANATDLHTIEEVLKLLDQPESPEEVLVNPKARLIPVYNMAADEVAEIVKQVFADKMQGASSRGGGGGEQRPSPADFFAAMRGGRGGSPRGGSSNSGNSNAPKEEPERMTVGVDSRSNSLIVFASQSVYEEVEMLVEELDSIAGISDDDATQVITLGGGVSPEGMKAALMAIMGENAISNSTSSSSNRSSTSSRTSSSRTGSTQRTGGVSDDMRRRFEMMRAMSRGGSPFGGRGGSSRGGPGGGR